MDAARTAILSVCPDAKVKAQRVDNYPVTVRVMTSDHRVLWRGSQKKLFRKYAQDRRRSMHQIAEAVSRFCGGGVVPELEEEKPASLCAIL